MLESQWFYKVDEFFIHPLSRKVECGDKATKVRPKTFALLKLLLENEQAVLSKDFIIQHIWDDVRVDEQVLVQSIRELRQLFSPLDVIQTHPRKGYVWIAPVQKVEMRKPAIISNNKTRTRLLFSILLTAAVALSVFGYVKFLSPKTAAKEIITILPVTNRMEGTNLAWVRLGVMDQLIQSLKLSQSLQVFDAPYVLRLLGIAGTDTQQRLSLINRLFEISGSSLVVDMQLSSSINDYRLLYHLYTPGSHSSGVLIDHRIDGLVASLAQIIAEKSRAGLNIRELGLEFNSGLLAAATEKWYEGQHEPAVALLNSLISLEPENFLAYQLLMEYRLALKDWAGVVEIARRVIPVAEQKQFARSYVFYFLLAEAENAQGHEDIASSALRKSQSLAEAGFDVLYQAYIAALWGDMDFSAGRYQEAEIHYQNALGLHQSISCPIGMSVIHNKFIELYAHTQKGQLRSTHERALKQLLKTYHLTTD